MKKAILNTGSAGLTLDLRLLIVRIAVSSLMLTHGIPKLMMLLQGTYDQFPAIFGMTSAMSLGIAVFAEVLCSLFILTGFATRLAAVPLIAIMLTAVFYVHSADTFQAKEPGLLYLIFYIILLIAGSGKYSADYLFERKAGHPDIKHVRDV